MTNPKQDYELDVIFSNYHLNGIGQGGLTSYQAKQQLLAWRRDSILKLLDKHAIDLERWVGGSQTTGHAEIIKAVPLDDIRHSIEEGESDGE
jgi:hypothetical protein